MLFRNGLTILLVVIGMRSFSATTEEQRKAAWQLSATYKGDFASNFNGGIKTGSTYLGLADLFMSFNPEQMGWWKGGEFMVHGANSHGGEPSANFIGDFQVASNIEAGNHTFLYELWYKQTLSKLTFTIGLQDLNAEFVSSDVAGLFLNSSFGVHSVISDNILAPIFPLTSPGITFCWDISEKSCLKTALYKGCPIDFDDNPYNVKWNINHLQGLLWITEGHYTWQDARENTSILKAGAFFHQHCENSGIENAETGESLSYDYGFYLIGDHEIMHKDEGNKGLNVFYQAGVSPRNDNFAYLGAGCAYTGLLSKKGHDMLGLAMARGLLTKERGKDETAIELTYKYQITDQIYLQPDFQYIIHPSGTDGTLKNASAGFLRLGLEF